MIKDFILDLIFPRFCIGCNKELNLKQASFICEACFNKIPLNGAERLKKTNLNEVWAAGKYQDPILREMIHQFKYQSIESLKKPLAQLMINYLEKEKLTEKLHPNVGSSVFNIYNIVLVPIPLTWRRKISRGFNQSELLAEELSQAINCPVINLLRRRKFSAPQARIEDWKRRKENISGAFELSLNELPEKVILIDDVTTSGATLEEAAFILKQAGVKEVYGLVVAN